MYGCFLSLVEQFAVGQGCVTTWVQVAWRLFVLLKVPPSQKKEHISHA